MGKNCRGQKGEGHEENVAHRINYVRLIGLAWVCAGYSANMLCMFSLRFLLNL